LTLAFLATTTTLNLLEHLSGKVIALPATTTTLNLLEHLSGKVIALPTLGFSKLLLRTLRELSCSHNTSTLASQKGK